MVVLLMLSLALALASALAFPVRNEVCAAIDLKEHSFPLSPCSHWFHDNRCSGDSVARANVEINQKNEIAVVLNGANPWTIYEVFFESHEHVGSLGVIATDGHGNSWHHGVIRICSGDHLTPHCIKETGRIALKSDISQTNSGHFVVSKRGKFVSGQSGQETPHCFISTSSECDTNMEHQIAVPTVSPSKHIDFITCSKKHTNYPDLILKEMHLSKTTFSVGEDVSASVKVSLHNNGASSTVITTLAFFISIDPVINASQDRKLENGIVDLNHHFNPNETFIIHPNLHTNIPRGICGSAYLGVLVDEMNSVSETDEHNNSLYRHVTIECGAGDDKKSMYVKRMYVDHQPATRTVTFEVQITDFLSANQIEGASTEISVDCVDGCDEKKVLSQKSNSHGIVVFHMPYLPEKATISICVERVVATGYGDILKGDCLTTKTSF